MKVYAPPQEIPVPKWTPESNFAQQEAQFLEALTAWCKAQGTGPHSGKVARFPHADGYAQYMVLDEGRTMSLIHVPLGDAWDLPEPYTRGLRKADIVAQLERQERMSKLFAAKR